MNEQQWSEIAGGLRETRYLVSEIRNWLINGEPSDELAFDYDFRSPDEALGRVQRDINDMIDQGWKAFPKEGTLDAQRERLDTLLRLQREQRERRERDKKKQALADAEKDSE